VEVDKWRRLRLRADNRWADGTPDVVEVETLQPPEWIEANHALPGALVPFPLDLQDMGLPGVLLARVVSNEPCPRLEQGIGRLVLSTVSHLNNDVWEIGVVDQNGRPEIIRPTGFHKVYSASRNAWVSAKDLKPDERLHGISGMVVVRTVGRVPGVHRVYNMTVEGEHIYRVSNLGVLVHNVGCAKPVAPYEVGRANALEVRSRGDDLHIHHVGQAHPMELTVPGYDRVTGPAIAIPRVNHVRIPNLSGPVNLTPRQIVARDIVNLRKYTSAPNSALQDLIQMNKDLYPGPMLRPIP
jgi:hypothetical protein